MNAGQTDTALVPCETCGTEGRRLTASSTDPNEAVDWGPCPDCGGTGEVEVATTPAGCDHDWRGPFRAFPDGNGGEATCFKCGRGAFNMWEIW